MCGLVSGPLRFPLHLRQLIASYQAVSGKEPGVKARLKYETLNFTAEESASDQLKLYGLKGGLPMHTCVGAEPI